MTPQELLIPRYKVIGPYPGSFYEVGEILTPKTDEELKVAAGIDELWHCLSEKEYVSKEEMDKCSTVFKLLHWSEDRKVEDMPEYVKVNEHGKKFIPEGIWEVKYFQDDCSHFRLCSGLAGTSYWVEPATEEEYDASVK